MIIARDKFLNNLGYENSTDDERKSLVDRIFEPYKHKNDYPNWNFKDDETYQFMIKNWENEKMRLNNMENIELEYPNLFDKNKYDIE